MLGRRDFLNGARQGCRQLESQSLLGFPQEKDAKMSFLQKAIDVVALVSGEPLSAKPARIVAGHDPERTNELLQVIGRCCLHKVGYPSQWMPQGMNLGGRQGA